MIWVNEGYAACETCGRNVDDCICPECPQCHQTGNRFCYDEGYLDYSDEQLLGQAKLDVHRAKEALADAEQYLNWLLQKEPANDH